MFRYPFVSSWSLALLEGVMFGVLMIVYRYVLWHIYFKRKDEHGDV